MGDDPKPALRKLPYEELAAKSGALKYKTRTQKYLVLVCQVPGIDVYRYFFALILLESWA